MKNLKKVLALVLVVAMMASFAVSAGAASFTDNDKIVYNDAVKLLSNLDVINGFTDGSFNPEGNVTRAQTAKMIAYIMNGGADASSTFAASAKFSDVANGYWAANSIGYCATKEIVAGAGNNLYYPNNDVTGVQLAKMALVALGYDPTIEKLTGSAWAINTINLAEDAGLFDDMNKDFNASAAASRQEAAQILYNMLLSEMVCYTDNGTNIIIGDITINTDATRKYMDKDGKGVEDKDLAVLAIEEYFDVQGSIENHGEDDYGRPARVISLKNLDDPIVLPYDADASFEGKVKSGDVYSAVGSTAAKYNLTVYVDGQVVVDDEKYDEVDAAWAVLKNESDKIGYTGATLEAYIVDYTDDNDTAVQKLVLVVNNTYLAQVNTVEENDDDADLIDVNLDLYTKTGYANSADMDELDSFSYEEDDYLLVNVAFQKTADQNKEPKSVDVIGAPETIEGIASTQANDYFKVDGTKYNLSNVAVENPAEEDYNGTYTFFLDNMGNIVGSTEIEAGTSSDKYVYVSESEASNGIDGARVRVKTKNMDGTSATVDLEVKETRPTGTNDEKTDCYKDPTTNNWVPVPEDDKNGFITAGFYSYTKDSNDKYTLKALDERYAVQDLNADTTELLDGDSDVGESMRATSSTKLHLIDSDTTYTGYRNFPEKISGSNLKVLYIHGKNSSTANDIYVVGDDGVSNDLIIAMFTGDTYVEDGDTYAEFYVNGGIESYIIDSVTNTEAENKDLIEDEIYALDGDTKGADATVVTSAEYDSGIAYKLAEGTITEVQEGSYFAINKSATFEYGYDDDNVELSVCDTTNDGEASKLRKNDVVKVVYINDGSDFALNVFIVD